MKTFRRTLLSLLLAAACTLDVPAQENQSYILHTIEKGQSLYSISSMYGVSQSDIIRLNPGSDQRIYVGRKLRIPRTAPDAMQETFHTIESGETLYRLSQQYGVSVQAICKANPGLSVVNFHAGEVIRIPAPTPKTSPDVPDVQPQDTIALRAEVKPRCRDMHITMTTNIRTAMNINTPIRMHTYMNMPVSSMKPCTITESHMLMIILKYTTMTMEMCMSIRILIRTRMYTVVWQRLKR